MAETDITELAQRLKASAEKATPGRIGDRIDGSGSIKYQCLGNDGSLVLQTDHKNMEYGFIGPNSNADELFFRMCSPENILTLVEALEKAQRYIEELREWNAGLAQEAFERQQHIAMLQNCARDKASHHAGCSHGNGENCASGNGVQDSQGSAGEPNNCRSNASAQVAPMQIGTPHAPESVQSVDHVDGEPLTITLPDITSKAFWSGSGKTEMFHPETYKRWVKEAIEQHCAIARIDVEVK